MPMPPEFEEVLDPHVVPTEEMGDEGEPPRRGLSASTATATAVLAGVGDPTEDDVLGPFYRRGAPFRGKLSPPLAPGQCLVIRGTVWGHDTKRPVPHVPLDLWHADLTGHYDNEDATHPPPPDMYVNRGRVVTDERGRYEYETIHPAPYAIDPTTWRAPHVHYRVRARGYRSLTTQLFFAGDPYIDTDPFIKRSLIIQLVKDGAGPALVERGTFDIVLARG